MAGEGGAGLGPMELLAGRGGRAAQLQQRVLRGHRREGHHSLGWPAGSRVIIVSPSRAAVPTTQPTARLIIVSIYTAASPIQRFIAPNANFQQDEPFLEFRPLGFLLFDDGGLRLCVGCLPNNVFK